MMKQIILILGIISLIIMTGCGFINPSVGTPDVKMHRSFDVDYYVADHSSMAGARILDITYNVRDGVVVSCSGTYSYPAPDRINNYEEACDVDRLKSNEYNVQVNLITEISSNDLMHVEETNGPFSYSYTVHPLD